MRTTAAAASLGCPLSPPPHTHVPPCTLGERATLACPSANAAVLLFCESRSTAEFYEGHISSAVQLSRSSPICSVNTGRACLISLLRCLNVSPLCFIERRFDPLWLVQDQLGTLFQPETLPGSAPDGGKRRSSPSQTFSSPSRPRLTGLDQLGLFLSSICSSLGFTNLKR